MTRYHPFRSFGKPYEFTAVTASKDHCVQGLTVSSDLGPKRSQLAGFKVAADSEGIQCLQSIYRQGSTLAAGGKYPPDKKPDRTIVAKDGYAVGGLVGKISDWVLHGMRIVFMRDLGDRLDPADRYESEWIGGRKGGPEAELVSEGRPIVGTHISWGWDYVGGLGWFLAREPGAVAGDSRSVPEFVRLTEIEPIAATTNFWPFSTNGRCDACWPVVSRDFHYCREFFYAHTPSTFAFDVPAGVKSFSAVGHCIWSGQVTFKVSADGQSLFASDRAGIVPVRVDLPPGCKRLELSVEASSRKDDDNSLWLSPRLHRRTISDTSGYQDDPTSVKLTDLQPTAVSVGSGRLEVNPAWGTKRPLAVDSYRICPEFIVAHAPSRLTYAIPEGAREFSAVGHIGSGFAPNKPGEANVCFQVHIDQKLVYESPDADTVPIQVAIPPGAKRLDLIVDSLDSSFSDHSYWCYPRFYWEPQPPFGERE